jgi:hypothetical protein
MALDKIQIKLDITALFMSVIQLYESLIFIMFLYIYLLWLITHMEFPQQSYYAVHFSAYKTPMY